MSNMAAIFRSLLKPKDWFAGRPRGLLLKRFFTAGPNLPRTIPDRSGSFIVVPLFQLQNRFASHRLCPPPAAVQRILCEVSDLGEVSESLCHLKVT